MLLFTSTREKRYWLWSIMVLLGIFASLFLGRPFLTLFQNQDTQAGIFVTGMVLVAAVIIAYALSSKMHWWQFILILGILAVYLMLFLRLGLAERSHLIEYSVLSIFVAKATEERSQQVRIKYPLAIAFGISFLVGITDECLQIMMPSRHFDLQDIIFNGFVITVALGARATMSFVRKKLAAKNN